MNTRVKEWLGLSREQLDQIYKQASAGTIPSGDTRGTAILTGSLLSKSFAAFVRLFAWQGKVFDLMPPRHETGILINKITPLSLTFVIAKVYKQASWIDEKETIVIDYSRTSFFAKKIRDEIREIEPGLYLGKVWWGKTRILDFALVDKARVQD
ncbi:hypothetical protein So717_03910 [Roseobacter cerasinus]|uniref:Uncharacterized protein n=1 Tax=Roseobacter cerasinus TaxID=2602289 RepID=A0A640VJJ5_9RHOB|nr:hypothetical protein [Roseobacter cerasinus]GFE48638.1 hypothetical protein So717_03910 [Roseobacter cerasinus]